MLYRIPANRRRGAVLPLVALCLIALFAMVALAIDIGLICVARNQSQNAADSAAMAGSRTISGDSTNNYNVGAVPGNAITAAVSNKVLSQYVQGDPSKEGPFVYRLKMPAGYKIPPHLHKASENVTVLSGAFSIGIGTQFDQGKGQELPVGGFVSIPPNHPHYAWAGVRETIVQVHGVGPTDLRFVNPADDPRNKK